MDIKILETEPPAMVLEGRFDAHEAENYRAAAAQIVDKHGPSFDVQLGGVRFLDSAALAELVRTMKTACSAGGDVRLCNPSAPVRVILELTGLDRAFVIVS